LIPVLTGEEMRKVDGAYINKIGIPSIVLMERAGIGVAQFVMSIAKNPTDERIVVLAGPGNNAGDAFVVSRYLMEEDHEISIIMTSDEDSLSKDARKNLGIIKDRNNLKIIKRDSNWQEALEGATIVIDGLLGTGAKPGLRGLMAEIAEFLEYTSSYVVAVDMPSGIEATTGETGDRCIKADATITLGFPKLGLFAPQTSEFVGDIYLHPLGYPIEAFTEIEVKTFLLEPRDILTNMKARAEASHKGDYGKLLVVAGSRGLVGAAVMTANTAVRGGAGLVKLALPETIETQARSHLIEVMTIPLPDRDGMLYDDSIPELRKWRDWADCVVFGPGVGVSDGVGEVLREILSWNKPTVIDADGINNLATMNIGKLPDESIITPHPGEMSRLLNKGIDKIQGDRINTARDCAKRYQTTVVLKGRNTIITEQDVEYGNTYINPTGGPSLASGGTGDILTGLIGSLMVQGYTPQEASVNSVYLHGLAGDIISVENGDEYLSATDLIEELPRAYDTVKTRYMWTEPFANLMPFPIWGEARRNYEVKGETPI